MSVFAGCQDARNMINIREIECPDCREIIEVFERDGRTVGDSACEKCGYIIPDTAYLVQYQNLKKTEVLK